MISLSIHLYFNIHRTYYLFLKLHELINKHVLAINVCFYSFCNEILMVHVFFSKVQILFFLNNNIFLFKMFVTIVTWNWWKINSHWDWGRNSAPKKHSRKITASILNPFSELLPNLNYSPIKKSKNIFIFKIARQQRP